MPAFTDRVFDSAAVIASVVLPLGMSASEGYAGLLQRLMFAIAMVWFGLEALRCGRVAEASGG